MNTELEQHVRDEFGAATTPPGLAIDPEGMTQLASRAHRRRRAGQVAGAGTASLALLLTLAWAGGALPGSISRALPASPWVCAVSGWSGGPDPTLDLDLVDEVRLPVSGGTVVAAIASQGCPFPVVVTGSTSAPPDQASGEIAMTGAVGMDARDSIRYSGIGDVPVGDEWALGITLSPSGVRDVQVVGPGEVRRPAEDPVRVPGSQYDFAVVEDLRASVDAPLAVVYRGPDGLVRSLFGLTQDDIAPPRAWQGPSDSETDVWVAKDSHGDVWAMREGEVRGPMTDRSDPVGQIFETDDEATIDLVVTTPDRGDIAVEGGLVESVEWLSTNPSADDVGLAAALVTVRLSEPAVLEVTWQPSGGSSQPVALED